jgi:serine/threonine-protein kinase
MVTIRLDEVKFDLKKEHDFKWLTEMGKVICVFDQNDSGNISFGVQQGVNKYFIKYAGAHTSEYKGDTQTAIDNLYKAINTYKDLNHEHTINFIKEIKTEEGVAAVFDWFDGECLFAHWTFDKWNRYNHPSSPYYKYKQLSLEKRFKSIDTIFKFLVYVENKQYVAVDFYDGSILYDFKTDTTKICDIDFYRKSPTINDIGEDFWGSRRFKAPEEYILGAPIDTITNVFVMGRLILGLIGDEREKSYEKWEASKQLYDCVQKAVSLDKMKRYQSMQQFYNEWIRTS